MTRFNKWNKNVNIPIMIHLCPIIFRLRTLLRCNQCVSQPVCHRPKDDTEKNASFFCNWQLFAREICEQMGHFSLVSIESTIDGSFSCHWQCFYAGVFYAIYRDVHSNSYVRKWLIFQHSIHSQATVIISLASHFFFSFLRHRWIRLRFYLAKKCFTLHGTFLGFTTVLPLFEGRVRTKLTHSECVCTFVMGLKIHDDRTASTHHFDTISFWYLVRFVRY